MKVWLILLLAPLLLAAEARADGPPAPAELAKLLEDEPFSADSWPSWSKRLREWSSDYGAARPAFDKAFVFVRSLDKLPRQMDRDAVAWMCLAGSYVYDKSELGSVVRGREAVKAARRAIGLDHKLAPAHFFLCQGIRIEQYTPFEKGGPAKRDANQLGEALKALNEARVLAPKVLWMQPTAAGSLAMSVPRWEEAEKFFRQALKEETEKLDEKKKLDVTQKLARCINEQQRSGSYAAAVGPLAEPYPRDGVLAAHLAWALFRDNQRDAAAEQLGRARQLGIDPSLAIQPGVVKQIDDERARKLSDQKRRETDEARRKEEEASRKESEAKRKAESEKRQADEAQQRKENEQRQRAWFEFPLRVLIAVGWGALYFTGFYALVMGSMCLTGLLLARWTKGLHAAELEAERLGGADENEGRVVRSRREARIAIIYGIALFLGLFFFYAALPFVLVGMLFVFLFLLVFLRGSGGGDDVHDSLVRASGGGVGALFKALFARSGAGGWGIKVKRDECPALFQAVDEVARRVDTEPPDEVWVAPGADFSVYQRGRGPFGMFGKRNRVLTVGMCVLNYISIGEFKAILAHEFGHFSHADTHWNRFVYQVRLSLATANHEMARTGGWVTWANPFYWFFWLYSKSFDLLASGFSRSREFLADRMACQLYGSDVFMDALRKVCTDGTHFESIIYKNIVILLRKNQAFVNMYLAFRKHRDENMTEKERQRLYEKFLDREAGLYSSHPSYQERLEASQVLPAARKKEDVTALKLFADPEAMERELTDYLTRAVASR